MVISAHGPRAVDTQALPSFVGHGMADVSALPINARRTDEVRRSNLSRLMVVSSSESQKLKCVHRQWRETRMGIVPSRNVMPLDEAPQQGFL